MRRRDTHEHDALALPHRHATSGFPAERAEIWKHKWQTQWIREPHSCWASTCRADKHHPCRQLSAYFIWSRPEVWLNGTWIKPSFLISLDTGHALQSVCFFLEGLGSFFFESFSRFWGYSSLFWTGQLKVKLAINPYWQRLAAWSYKVPGMLANDELSLMARCLPVVSF